MVEYLFCTNNYYYATTIETTFNKVENHKFYRFQVSIFSVKIVIIIELSFHFFLPFHLFSPHLSSPLFFSSLSRQKGVVIKDSRFLTSGLWKKSKLKCEMIWKIRKKGKLNSEKIWKIQKKIVKRNGNYERKISWIVKRYGKYRRKLWNDMENTEEK